MNARMTFLMTAAVILLPIIGTESTSANIINNPGFENGTGTDAADWEELPNGPNGTVTRSTLMPNMGSHSAYLEFNNATPAGGAYFIQQVTAANTVDNSVNHDFSFSAKVDSTDFTGMDMFYEIQWLDQDNSDGGGVKGVQLVSLPGQGINTSYQQFGFSDFDVPDGADSALVRFQVSAGAVANAVNGMHVDDVSLQAVIPEPTSIAALALGCLILLGTRRRLS